MNDALHHVGAICTFKVRGLPSFGRILRATASGINVERLQRTDTGAFTPHPETVCPVTRNQLTFTRDIRVLPHSAALAGAVMDADG